MGSPNCFPLLRLIMSDNIKLKGMIDYVESNGSDYGNVGE